MTFSNFSCLSVYLITFMSGAKEFVWAQGEIYDLVSNAGWLELTDVNSVRYGNRIYGVNDLTSIPEEIDCINVAMIILGCSHASTMLTVSLGYKNSIVDCLEMQSNEEEFNRCAHNISESMVYYNDWMARMDNALKHLKAMKNSIYLSDQESNDNDDDNDDEEDEQDPTTVFSDIMEQIGTWENLRRNGEPHLDSLYRAYSYFVEKTLELENDPKCDLRDPQYESTLNGWIRKYRVKLQNGQVALHEHIIEEVEDILRLASITKYTKLGFV